MSQKDKFNTLLSALALKRQIEALNEYQDIPQKDVLFLSTLLIKLYYSGIRTQLVFSQAGINTVYCTDNDGNIRIEICGEQKCIDDNSLYTRMAYYIKLDEDGNVLNTNQRIMSFHVYLNSIRKRSGQEDIKTQQVFSLEYEESICCPNIYDAILPYFTAPLDACIEDAHIVLGNDIKQIMNNGQTK